MSISRRKFLIDSTLASAALATGLSCSPSTTNGSSQLDSTAAALTNSSSSKNRLGVALVGLGGYSSGQLAPALQLTDHCYLAGIVTGSPEKIPEWQSKYGIKDGNVYNYENMHEIANNDDIDVIYIVLPPSLHAKYSIIAANTGKHVWCEKPMAMNVEECQAMIDACNKNKVKLSIGYRVQHEPDMQRIMQFAETKPYGEMSGIRSLAGYRGGGGTGWRFDKEMGGGALYDMGVYTINGIRHAAGREPVRVLSARQWTDRPDIFEEVDESTEYELEFADGMKAYGRTSVGENMNLLRVECAKGWYELEPMQAYSGVKGRTSDGKEFNEEPEDQQAKQMDDDALAILNNQPVLVPGEDGLRDIRLVQAIMEAAKTGKAIPV